MRFISQILIKKFKIEKKSRPEARIHGVRAGVGVCRGTRLPAVELMETEGRATCSTSSSQTETRPGS
jgi:hypothetical protein